MKNPAVLTTGSKKPDVAAIIAGGIAVVAGAVWIASISMPLPQEEIAPTDEDKRAVAAAPQAAVRPAAPAAPSASAPTVSPAEARVAQEPEQKSQGAPRSPAEPAKSKPGASTAASSTPAVVQPRVATAPQSPSAAAARAEAPKSGSGADAALEAMRGRYVGNMFSSAGSETVGFSLVISAVANGTVTGTASLGGRGCNGDYPMQGTYQGRKLQLRATRNGGPAGDCPLNLVLTAEGNRLVGATDGGDRIQLAK
ncbi:MAG TPA: hypothetical protein VGP15_08130 [Burkholderiales bacterium]|nr:hypothetical protein [Burkholderiales bacterium]